MRFYVIKLLLLVLLCFVTVSYAIDGDEIIKKTKKKFNSTENFSANFIYKFKWKLADQSNEYYGKIYLKHENKFRIETDDQLIVSDSKTLWTYSKLNNQVIIDNLENAEGNLLPSEMFLKFSNEYKNILKKEEKIDDSDCYLVLLTAKDKNIFIKEMKVWIDKKTWLTKKIEHVDINENITGYTLKNILINSKLDNNLFKFKNKNNIEVIDMR